MKLKIAKTTAILAGASLLLGGTALFAADDAANPPQQAAQPANGGELNATDPAMFINAVNNINRTEIEMGRLAKERGQTEAVKKMGAHMVRDHTSMETKLKTLASSKDINLPNDLDAGHQKMVDELAAFSGADFDRHYVDDMVKGHQKAISFFQNAAAQNSDQAVREFASKALPQLQHHLQMAEKDAGIVNEPAGAGQ